MRKAILIALSLAASVAITTPAFAQQRTVRKVRVVRTSVTTTTVVVPPRQVFVPRPQPAPVYYPVVYQRPVYYAVPILRREIWVARPVLLGWNTHIRRNVRYYPKWRRRGWY